MNQEQAKHLLPFLQAIAAGKTIQWNDLGDWVDFHPDRWLGPNDIGLKMRIKPKAGWFRVAIFMTDGGSPYVMTYSNCSPDSSNWNDTDAERRPQFHRWATERINYEP